MFDNQKFTGVLGSKALEHQLQAIERDEARRQRNSKKLKQERQEQTEAFLKKKEELVKQLEDGIDEATLVEKTIDDVATANQPTIFEDP